MKKLNGFDNAKVLGEVQEQLPVGGYVLKILSVEPLTYDWGDVINISFDIIEGEHKDFYKNNYASQTQEDKKWKGTYRMNVPKDDGSERDEWTMRRFKTDIQAIEDSNSGYHWDWNEAGLKGKIVGGIFHNKEWAMNGNSGFYTACHSFRSIGTIRSGNFKIPKDKLLNSNNNNSSSGASPLFDDDDSLPFN